MIFHMCLGNMFLKLDSNNQGEEVLCFHYYQNLNTKHHGPTYVNACYLGVRTNTNNLSIMNWRNCCVIFCLLYFVDQRWQCLLVLKFWSRFNFRYIYGTFQMHFVLVESPTLSNTITSNYEQTVSCNLQAFSYY